MRTRRADTPKSATTAKKTPAKKSTAKTPPKPTEPAPESSATPKSAEVKPASTTKAQQVKTATTSAAPESEPELPAVTEANAAADAVQVTPETEPTPGAKKTRKVIRKVMVRRKTSASAKAASNKTPKPGEPEEMKVEETSKKEGTHDVESVNKEEQTPVNTEVSMNKEETAVENVEGSTKEAAQAVESVNKEEQTPVNTEVSMNKEETAIENVEGSTKEEALAVESMNKKVQTSLNTEVSKNKEETTIENVEESTKKAAQAVESVDKEEQHLANTEVSTNKEETTVENVEGSTKEDQNVRDVEEPLKKEEAASDAPSLVENAVISSKEEDPVVTETAESSENQEINMMEEEKEINAVEDKVEPDNEPVNMEKDVDERMEVEDFAQKEDVSHGDEKMEEHSGRENHEEVGDEELSEDNVVEHGEKAEAMEEEPAAEELGEGAELTALAHERKSKREMEIFVGGLDRDATEEDVKKVFVSVGEVLEVRLHKSSATNKNKGYAFVRFATKEQASRALAEMKNPLIHGKRCGTAPSEDNNTLFLGNICNSWTKEAIKQKLKDYSIEGVESITLVPNPQHEGLSRGFAFVEFSCHADAMLAYKRLQKPDAIFGHSERTAKVAFAEPLREPDPEVMAQVKSVFIDGLPQYWDEDRVRQQFKGYGEIERITLARNMSTAKRKDFGFVDFTTHEAAIACIDDINTKELGDGKKKTKVKARLSNPQPKIQVVKGGMCGGFRIGRAGSGTFAKRGGAFGRGGHSFNRSDFQGSRGFHQRGRGQPGTSFANEHELDNPYASFQGRQNVGRGGRWGSSSGAHHVSGGSNLPARVNLDRQRYNGPSDRGRGRNMPYRGHLFSPEEELNRPFLGRHTDEHYMYDDISRGMKRPYFADHDPDYLEPSRVRPRLDYTDPPVPRGSYYRDTYGSGSGLYSDSRDYYGPDHGRGAHSSFYGGHRPYGGGPGGYYY